MSITDGSPVNAATTNPAFISRTTDSNTVGKVGLKNGDVVSGSDINNAQRLINELADVQGNTGEGDATSKTYATTNVLTDGDNRKQGLEAFDAEFDPTTGHSHDGVNSPKVNVVDIDGLSTLEALYQVKESFSADGIDDDVSAEYAADTAGGDASTEGVITTPPNNRVHITESNTGQELEDGTGKRVFGRITEAAGTWTLTYFVLDAGVEASTSITGPININIFYREVFGPVNQRPTIPADVGSFDSQNATADILDASATQAGKVNTIAQEFSGVKNFTVRPTINGNDAVDINQAQVITNKDIDGVIASDTNRITLPRNTTVNLTALTRKQGTVFYDTDQANFFGDDGTNIIPLGGGSGGGAGSLDTYYSETFESYEDTAELIAAFTLTGNGTLELDETTELNGTKSLKYTQVAGSLGADIQSPFTTIQNKQKNRESKVRFTVSYSGADNDIELEILGLKINIRNGVNIIEGRYFIKDEVTINYKLNVLVENIGAILILDDVELTTDTAFAGSLIDTENTVRVEASNGYGSTNTKIRRFSTTVESFGGAITYIDSATDGASFTVNNTGYYSINFGDNFGGANWMGITRNSTELTTNIQSIVSTIDRLAFAITSGNGRVNEVTWAGRLEAGDVIRPHTEGSATGASGFDFFSMSAILTSDAVIQESEIPENEYTARINNAGAAVVSTENVGGWIDTATRNSLGSVTIDYTSLGLTSPPSITATSANDVDAYCTGVSVTTTSCEIRTRNSGALKDVDFNIQMSLQELDYKDLTVNLIQAVPRVAILKHSLPQGTNGGSSFTTYGTRIINTIEGDSSFLSVTSNQITLSPGLYVFEGFGVTDPFLAGFAKSRFQNVTDATTICTGTGVRGGTVVFNDRSDFTGSEEITQAKTYEVQTMSQLAVANGHGQAVSFGGSEEYVKLKITKLK